MDDIDEILTENKNSQLAEYDYERQEQDMDYNDDEEEDGEEGLDTYTTCLDTYTTCPGT